MLNDLEIACNTKLKNIDEIAAISSGKTKEIQFIVKWRTESLQGYPWQILSPGFFILPGNYASMAKFLIYVDNPDNE